MNIPSTRHTSCKTLFLGRNSAGEEIVLSYDSKTQFFIIRKWRVDRYIDAGYHGPDFAKALEDYKKKTDE